MEAPTAVPRRVLALCHNVELRRVIEEATQPWMFETVVSASLQESIELLENEEFAVVFCEDKFEGGAYPKLLSEARRPRKVPVVVMISDVNQDVVFEEAMEMGAFGVMAVPCSRKDVQWLVIRATQHSQARRGSR
jgi:DNA-binding NtrC family response regulator